MINLKDNLPSLFLILLLVFSFTLVYNHAKADCTGCGDDGHQVCPVEKKHKHVTILKQEHAVSESEPENGVVFAVCIFEVAEDGTRKLVDHVASENLMNCLKNKREAERKYKESKEKDGVFNMTCDKVNAKVRVKEDGSWEILEILGRHEQAYERKKVYE
tara:strand:+ start:28 stop:507 length:480 start_codon:yes stop_codon:yes gene_type:complete